ncbi:MAG: GNAT family N-acetyltransferase [Candidatus Odinarchaeota archaeon]
MENRDIPDSDANITLREVTRETVRTICRLDVAENQKKFVAPNAVSIAEAYFARDTAWFRAIYAGETPVGFVMVADDPEKGDYFLWRFMIDWRYQGKGFGKKALELVIQRVKGCPGVKAFYTSHVKQDGGPEGFYKKIGFVDTGKIEHGEHVMKLELNY